MITIDAEFLFDNNLIAQLENLIRSSNKKLLLVSPYIDLDERIQDALREKKDRHDFSLRVLFGKNEDNIYKSIKKNSIEFLKDFPNIEIRYNERLHAKFYINDYDFIITSLNLYDFSLAKNIEVGVKVNYALKGALAKTFYTPEDLLSQGIDKLKETVLGANKETDPTEKFENIFANSTVKYKTQPKIVDKKGLSGVFGGKKLDGYEILVDTLDKHSTNQNPKFESKENKVITLTPTISHNSTVKLISATQISKMLGITPADITNFMQHKGLIDRNQITPLGLSRGLMIKSYMGSEYIGYPENLIELGELKNRFVHK